MQCYSYQFSSIVVEKFLSTKPRGWSVVQKYSNITKKVLIWLFMHKKGKAWEGMKYLISRGEALSWQRGPTWTDKVWVEQLCMVGRAEKLAGLLNKCLVLTDKSFSFRLIEHVKPVESD